MNKFITMMLALVVMLFAVNSFAWDPPTSPAPASWISDPSGILSSEAHARLDAKLKVINQSSANEIAALILPTLDGQDIADVGDKTAKAWGVGKKNLDNGVLVVLAMKEHKSRISTGKGVEGDLPDLKCNDILQSARPYLRKGDVEGALGFIFDSSSQAIVNHKADVAAGRSSNSSNGAACSVPAGGVGTNDSDPTGWLITAGLFAVGLWWVVSTVRRNRRRQMEAQEEALAEMARETERMRKQNEQRAALQKVVDERKQREAELHKPTPVVEVPVIPRPTTTHHPIKSRPTVHISTVSTATLAAEEEARKQREAAARRKREQEDEDRRRRQREEDDRRRSDDSSSSSSSSSDWGGGSSGGFGGGDFGGGGSSGDW